MDKREEQTKPDTQAILPSHDTVEDEPEPQSQPSVRFVPGAKVKVPEHIADNELISVLVGIISREEPIAERERRARLLFAHFMADESSLNPSQREIVQELKRVVGQLWQRVLDKHPDPDEELERCSRLMRQLFKDPRQIVNQHIRRTISNHPNIAVYNREQTYKSIMMQTNQRIYQSFRLILESMR